ncbi:MAG: MazG-like family protein [Ginsengibacter sp.]
MFSWKNPEDVNIEKLKEELAGIFSFCFFLAEKYNFNVKGIIPGKLIASDDKYPADKSKGTAKKYNES